MGSSTFVVAVSSRFGVKVNKITELQGHLQPWTHKMASNDELACVYAALIIMDDDVSITVEKINTILKAADVAVEPYWPGLFAKAAGGLDLKSIVSNIGAGVSSGGGGGGAPAAAAGGDAPAEKEKEPEPEEEESDEDMGFSLL